MTIGGALDAATRGLAGVSDSPRLDAEVLMAHVLQRARSTLFAYRDDGLDDDAQQRFDVLVGARRDGQPVAYLTGQREFWSLSFAVSAAVLVPRADTEVLVEWALSLPLPDCARVVDLGTGSGAIAIALAHERPGWQVLATDASPAALAQARANAERLVPGRVRLAQGDWFAACADEARFELIVSNPPYIARQDPHLSSLGAEPLQALSDGGDGLSALRRIAAEAPRHLRPGGWLLLEHGHTQGAAVRDLLAAARLGRIETRRDYAGCERITGGCRA